MRCVKQDSLRGVGGMFTMLTNAGEVAFLEVWSEHGGGGQHVLGLSGLEYIPVGNWVVYVWVLA